MSKDINISGDGSWSYFGTDRVRRWHCRFSWRLWLLGVAWETMVGPAYMRLDDTNGIYCRANLVVWFCLPLLEIRYSGRTYELPLKPAEEARVIRRQL